MSHSFMREEVNGIRLHILPTDRFKTYAVSMFIGHPLQEETVTSHALTPFVLRRGTVSYPETKRFREHLDELYGAGFGFDIYKRGDNQIVQFRIDTIHDHFGSSETKSLLEQTIQLLGEIVTAPATENGQFVAKYVESEKTTLRKKLEAIINDKIRYAAERCLEAMCEDEPYRLHPLGRIGDLEQLTPEGLFAAYRNLLQTAPIDLYIVGDVKPEDIRPLIARYFAIPKERAALYKNQPAHREAGETKTVVERLDVSQGKLNMGLRTHVTYADDAYPAALMYNGIFGGYPHSKLFINVREKASLAYYASSRLDGHKGILTIQSGIEIANYEKAVRIIKEQLAAMEQGEYTELELSQTKAMITNQLREIQDSAFEMIAFDFNRVLSGKERTTTELIEQVNGMKPDDIRQVAQKVKLDTIYFLTDRKESGI